MPERLSGMSGSRLSKESSPVQMRLSGGSPPSGASPVMPRSRERRHSLPDCRSVARMAANMADGEPFEGRQRRPSMPSPLAPSPQATRLESLDEVITPPATLALPLTSVTLAATATRRNSESDVHSAAIQASLMLARPALEADSSKVEKSGNSSNKSEKLATSDKVASFKSDNEKIAAGEPPAAALKAGWCAGFFGSSHHCWSNVHRWAIDQRREVTEKPIIYFTKHASPRTLTTVIRYIVANEQRRWIKFVRVVPSEAQVPPEVPASFVFLQEAHPELTIELVHVVGIFGPNAVRTIAAELHVPSTFTFMGSFDEALGHSFTQLGGLRIITSDSASQPLAAVARQLAAARSLELPAAGLQFGHPSPPPSIPGTEHSLLDDIESNNHRSHTFDTSPAPPLHVSGPPSPALGGGPRAAQPPAATSASAPASATTPVAPTPLHRSHTTPLPS